MVKFLSGFELTKWTHISTSRAGHGMLNVSIRCDLTALYHYSEVLLSGMGYQITGVSMVSSTVCSGADQRKHQSSASLAFVKGINRCPVNSPHVSICWRHHDIDYQIRCDNTSWNHKLKPYLLAEYLEQDSVLLSQQKTIVWIRLDIDPTFSHRIDNQFVSIW